MPKVTKSKGAAAAADELLPAAATMTDIEAGVEGMEAEGPSTTGDAAAAGGSGAVKPKFPPLSSYEANGRRIEFRRVPVPQVRRGSPRFLGAVELAECLHVYRLVKLFLGCGLCSSSLCLLAVAPCCRCTACVPAHPTHRLPGCLAAEPHDAAEEQLAGAVQAGDRKPQAGHAHEPEDAQGGLGAPLPWSAWGRLIQQQLGAAGCFQVRACVPCKPGQAHLPAILICMRGQA